jgi:outer membrane protein
MRRTAIDSHRKEVTLQVITLLLLPLLAAGRGLRGEEKPPLRLTLREAVQLALKENPQVQIASLNVAQSEQDGAGARAALLPQVGIEVYDRAQRFNLEAFIGHRLPGTPQHAGPFQTFQAGTGFSMPVFDLTLWRRWQASRQGVKATEAQESTVREQIVLLVVSQYLGGLRAAANVRAARSRAELAQALFDQAADLQKYGVGTGLDALRANVQLQNEKQRLIVAATQQKTSLYGLGRLLNLDPYQTVDLADEMSFFETPEFEAAQSLERSFSTRPEMKALESRDRIARFEKQAASESRLPKVALGGSWGYQGLSAPSAIPSYQYQVTVDVPLFTGGRIQAERVKAALELKKVEQEREELRNQIALQVKTALAELEAARHEVDVANLGVNLAQQEVEQARDRFQAGVANNIEIISAQDALARANDNQIAALYRYNQSRADLAYAIGQIETLYTK